MYIHIRTTFLAVKGCKMLAFVCYEILLYFNIQNIIKNLNINI